MTRDVDVVLGHIPDAFPDVAAAIRLGTRVRARVALHFDGPRIVRLIVHVRPDADGRWTLIHDGGHDGGLHGAVRRLDPDARVEIWRNGGLARVVGQDVRRRRGRRR